jgi:hypothetical protein
MISGNIKDSCFSTLSFLKSKLHNQLIKHLDLVINMFAKDHYIFYCFPFGDATKDWSDNKVKYVMD